MNDDDPVSNAHVNYMSVIHAVRTNVFLYYFNLAINAFVRVPTPAAVAYAADLNIPIE